jgi:hypothetical protein
MLRGNRELWWAFCGDINAAMYGGIFVTRKIPAASELFGRTIGIFGCYML